MKNWKLRAADSIAVALTLTFAFYLRYLFRDHETGDFHEYTSVWYAAIKSQGFFAVGTDVANYTPPYLYLLYITSVVLPDLPPVVAIKIPSTLGDLLCAWMVLLIVRLRYPGSSPHCVIAFVAVLLAPTVIVNSAFWGQADSIYTGILLGCVYACLTGRYAMAMVVLGLAVAFKLQAIFLAIAIACLFAAGKIPFRTVMIIPAVYALAMLPAWLAGRPAIELATIYLNQAKTYPFLTANAPSIYALLPIESGTPFVIAGLLVTAAAGISCVWAVRRCRHRLSTEVVMHLCMLSVIVTPFLLPKMHDRFFFPADILSIGYAFWFPRLYFLPIFIGFASFFAYQAYLFGHFAIPLPLLSLILLAALLTVLQATRKALHSVHVL